MKKLKKIVTLLTLAAVCLTAPAFGKITVKAAEPATYVLNYSSSKGEWRFKPASSWSEEVQDRELYYLMQDIKDGDYIVIQNDVDCNPLNLNVPVRLGNLTIKNTFKAPVITAKGYDSVYVLDGTTAAINGDVSHAYVYGGARVNFNNNVDTLEMYGYGGGYNNLHAYITVVGTVNHLSAKDGQTMETYYDYYNFAANKLFTEDGALRTDAQYYSKTAPAATTEAATTEVAQPAAAAQPAATAQPAASSSTYDDVPKTGESALSIYLMVAAVLCVVSGYALRKKNA